MFKPRKPNQREKEQLADYLSDLIWYEVDEPSEEARNAVENAAMAVFDNYVSDSPGYVGKIMTVVWGWPQMYEVFIWRDGEIVHVNQDPQFQKEE